MLHFDRYGPETGRPLLIVHGLFGSARNWGVLAKRMAQERPVVAVDMRNHGNSPHTDRHLYPDLAADLADVARSLGGAMDVLGHSMGGKAAMVLALTEPDLIHRLVVADIAPVAYSHTQLPLVEAMRGLDLTGLDRRSAADQRLAATVEDATVRAFLLQSLDLKADPPRWTLNLDTLARDMDALVGWPNTPGIFAEPTLFLSGATSDYVLPTHRDQIHAQFPKARFAKIPGAGHWLHAEKPREVQAAVEALLSAE